MCKEKILLILTGGTICSFSNSEGEKSSNAMQAKRLIRELFEKSDSKYKNVQFDDVMPMNILSENMTLDRWNEIIKKMKSYKMEDYKGVIMLHGTDTLAYTASIISLLLSGLTVPFCLVSSQLPLYEKEANGSDNFRVAVDMIMNGIEPNVYVPYKNMDGKMYVHLGSHIRQCPNLSNDFSSADPWFIEDIKNINIKGAGFESNTMLINEIESLKPSVLKISPYVGLDYSKINMDGIEAVVHGTYHSQTLCVEKNNENEETTNFSVFSLKECFAKENANKNKVPLFLETCNYKLNEGQSCYETTAEVVKNGAIPIWGMTCEMAYAKVLVGVALGYKNDDLKNFVLNNRINGEFYY